MASRIRIGLLWHSATSGNLGVGALTVANLAIVRREAEALGLEPEFTILGMRDGHVAPILPPEVGSFIIDTRKMISPRGFWRAVGGLDCVVDIGAGDSFADIYGAKRFGFLWFSKLLSLVRRVPLVLAPQTIGPFGKQPYKALAGAVMARAAAVVARDWRSFEVIGELAPRARRVLATDVAFLLPFESRAGERGGAKLRVGVNASGLLFREAELGSNRFGMSIAYDRFVRELIERLLARGDVEVHLVPHATSTTDPSDDDAALADRLAREFPAAIRVPNFPGPSEAKSYISGLDFLVASRMHACIAAFSSGTPVVPVAYSRKFEGTFGLLGYDRLVPVKGVDEDGAIAFVMAALEDRAALAAAEAAGMTRVGELMEGYRTALREVLGRAAARRR